MVVLDRVKVGFQIPIDLDDPMFSHAPAYLGANQNQMHHRHAQAHDSRKSEATRDRASSASSKKRKGSYK
jgi:hypothetical protein